MSKRRGKNRKPKTPARTVKVSPTKIQTQRRRRRLVICSSLGVCAIVLICLVVYFTYPNDSNNDNNSLSSSILEVVRDDLRNASTIFTTIVSVYPHDSDAFTQGLEFHGGQLYESTGMWGRSSVRKVNYQNGETQLSAEIAADLFGEGITIWDDRLFMLTWQSREGFIFDPMTLVQQDVFPIVSDNGQGWGLTHNDQWLILSDGSNVLYFLNPQDLQEVKRLEVYELTRKSSDALEWDRHDIINLNELEVIGNYIFANVWFDNRIAIICPTSGEVIAWIDLTEICEGENADRQRTLNGIAFDELSRKFYVTGKLWSNLYEIVLPDEQTII